MNRLTPEDFDQLKTQAIAQFPGVWLHHYGHMVEEEVLRRNCVPFAPTNALIPGSLERARHQASLDQYQASRNLVALLS